MTATIQLLLALGFGRTAALADLATTVVALAVVAVVLRARRSRPADGERVAPEQPVASASSDEPEVVAARAEHQPA